MDSWEALDLDDSDLLHLSAPLPPPTSKRSASPARSPSPRRWNQKKLHGKPPTQTLPLSLLQPCSQIPRPSPPQSQTQSSTLDFPSCNLPTTTAPITAATNAKCRIPGPAGAVQAAMHRRVVNPPTSSQFGLRISQEIEECDDEDFKRNPWLCALEFLGGGSDLAAKAHMLCSIRDYQNSQRVPMIIGMIKSCKPNGLGDLIISLKDPSGIVDATIHRKVVSQSKYSGEITAGSVLVLQQENNACVDCGLFQVVVFPTFRSAHYLNITLNNVVKVFGKDSRALPRELSPFPVNHADSGNDPESTTEIAKASTSEGVISLQETKTGYNDAELVERTQSDTVAGNFNCCTSSFDQTLIVKDANLKSRQIGNQLPVTVAPHTSWTDEQISELFADIEDW